ncbi:MAG: endopeptidase La [Thermodesulfobacteriota bacterium]|nr:endopeptidase La [Thermodesulfobacteriota bacterium]
MALFKKEEKSDTSTEVTEIEEWREKISAAKMPENVTKVAMKELDKMAQTSPSSGEYTIALNYIDYLISLPWHAATEDRLDIKHAEAVLNEEHFGLEEIKNRILEYLAVRIIKLSRQYSILVVDDEVRTRKNLEHVLTKEGYLVTTAKNGAEALERLDTTPVDIIITDLKMDKVDGMEVLEKAREKDPGVEVIVITGYATVTSAVEAMKRGSFNYITKPFKLEEIRATVRQALGAKKQQLRAKGPILCFAGPPGTGKTSLGMSIARSLGKEFIRISLAGVKDESEIRGHRRSYVGAMPGRIIREIRGAGASNPVFMLDELDKFGQDVKGDPAAALLEVLDPQQNATFVDHYLDVPFDLSAVMFIATANIVDQIPGPLLDRLEVLNLSGYTEEEKERIAFDYLIPRAIKDNGLENHPPVFTPEAVQAIIGGYTREAGLRDLQRRIDAICRKSARDILGQDTAPDDLTIDADTVRDYLGPRKYHAEMAQAEGKVGIATALAWTASGGEIIFIEATKMKGRSNLMMTGSLGDVMKESAQAALSYIRSNAERLDIPENFFDLQDLHIHIPAGAIPKDGPSAGLTIGVALISLLTGRPARPGMAFTGEITLSGRILPVGGIREKLLAARRAGVKTVVLPARNEADVQHLPDPIKADIKIILADQFDDIVDSVLVQVR